MTQKTKIIFSHGEKGGVGKSLIASVLIDSAINKFGADQVLVVEGDPGIRDVADRYRGHVRGEAIPLNRPDPMAAQDAVSHLFDRVTAHAAQVVVVNLPSAAGETLDPLAPDLIAPAAEAMGIEIGVTFAVGPGVESARAAQRSQESGLVSITYPTSHRLAVLNAHLGTPSRFAWRREDNAWEGHESTLPPLLERVASKMRSIPGPLSVIAESDDLQIVERIILWKWLKEANEIGRFFFDGEVLE
ncbi:hypothetical protein [Methylohalobius crimeensis]|uniref:hypothetical protein n=1 Tax=Methylohalobius crimeensis TaxID=244365 RepID=UPI0003B2FFF7|nr:hypothetical protein [Methylohalobius crimeensis]